MLIQPNISLLIKIKSFKYLLKHTTTVIYYGEYLIQIKKYWNFRVSMNRKLEYMLERETIQDLLKVLLTGDLGIR